MKKIVVIFFFILSKQFLFAQNNYFIYFTDKQGTLFTVYEPAKFLSQRAINRRIKQNIPIRESDLPVSKTYLDQIDATGAKVIYTSKWLNAAFIQADAATFDLVKNLPCIRKDKNLNLRLDENTNHWISLRSTEIQNKFGVMDVQEQPLDYGVSLTQNKLIGVDAMHQDGFKGDGIVIAVLDAGFKSANTLPIFDSLFKNNSVLFTYDFVKNESSVYEDNDHGTYVLSCLGGYLSGSLIAPAYRAKYLLFRTEDFLTESKKEEIYWLRAAEYADSVGVDIISSSLGYTTFDNPATNYSINQLDGKTALITQAANYASATGMVIVVSAGNEGLTPWRKITFPADSDSVLTVGSVNKFGVYASTSSSGLPNGKIKPDVVAMGSAVTVASLGGGVGQASGTSFAAPTVAGLVAGLWQAYPELTNKQLIDLVRRSSTKYTAPDTLIGYGIPGYQKAKQLMTTGGIDEIGFPISMTIYPNPIHDEPLTIILDYPCSDLFPRLAISDIYGKEIFSGNLNMSSSAIMQNIVFEINQVKNLASGVYILRIFSGKKICVAKKIIKY